MENREQQILSEIKEMMASIRSQLELLDMKMAELQQAVDPEGVEADAMDLDLDFVMPVGVRVGESAGAVEGEDVGVGEGEAVAMSDGSEGEAVVVGEGVGAAVGVGVAVGVTEAVTAGIETEGAVVGVTGAVSAGIETEGAVVGEGSEGEAVDVGEDIEAERAAETVAEGIVELGEVEDIPEVDDFLEMVLEDIPEIEDIEEPVSEEKPAKDVVPAVTTVTEVAPAVEVAPEVAPVVNPVANPVAAPAAAPAVEQKVSEVISIAEKAEENAKPTLNDVKAPAYAWKRDMAGSPVRDIRSAISLNDRVIFINMLFREDAQLFVNTLMHINTLTTLEDAVEYLTRTFPQWDMNSEVVYHFMMAVRRKVQ